jgi:methylenetetrahydrofolate reductase (NADPH)
MTLSAAELAALKQRVSEFARNTSTEISAADEKLLDELAGVLPKGMTVYVAHTGKEVELPDVIRIATKVQKLGYRASPHIAARRQRSEQELRDNLKVAVDAGVEQVLLIAGDLNPPAGPFDSSMAVLESGAIIESGIEYAGVAGHPEGNPNCPDDMLWKALAFKQDYMKRTGLKIHVATQFSFNPKAVAEWDAQLQAHGIDLPVHMGIAGPTPLAKLLKYAAFCGIGASAGALFKNLGNFTKMATGMAMTPDEMLLALINNGAGRPPSRIVQPHYFAFGGTMITAQWLKDLVEGNFELDPSGTKFLAKA